ncbi:MAG: hypothetical protein ABH826_03705 [Patescibacteria group bacterium]|nr:hypothetical protein [Patescibacteria group bacterium]
MINKRQAHILSLVVSEFIATAQPVASKTIVDKFQLEVSPATVRNDMAVLEAVGYLRQPHTSSGRIPTENGYRFYLANFVDSRCSNRIRAPLRRAVNDEEVMQKKLHSLANVLVELSGETALASLITSPCTNWMHYSGIANLFEKPDFKSVEMMRTLSSIVDGFDGVLSKMFDTIDKDINIWIGEENPFGSQISTVMVKYKLPNGMTGLLGLVGPHRMDYEKNIRLLAEARNLLDEEV